MTEYRDILIIGAGLSGIAAAYYFHKNCPHKSYLILEGRDAMGGTWDLFRYPGIRSDSDMHTLGYSFRPWIGDKALADGESIRNYIRETAAAYGIDRDIRYQQHVISASWSSEDARWTLEVGVGAEKVIQHYSCNFLYMATGYYDYDGGYTPNWSGMERYQGQLVHPQKWPDDLDYTGKKVLVIGSGATAVTLVPAMAEKAAHVTMLQRTPTYIVSRPAIDGLPNRLEHFLPNKIAHQIVRWKSILLQMYFYLFAQRFPETTKKSIKQMVRDELGSDYDVEKHFSPPYNPWDQRLCLVPDSDLFKMMRAGKVSIVTDTLTEFTETGVCLASGERIDADIIVTATGLAIKLVGGLQLIVDSETIVANKLLSYKGLMFSHIPNFAQASGYTNASWTLKCELIAQYVCRLLNYMDKHDYVQCVPLPQDEPMETKPLIGLTSGYIQRAVDTMPRQGNKNPWRVYQNYLLDVLLLRYGKVNDAAMVFSKQQQPMPERTERALST